MLYIDKAKFLSFIWRCLNNIAEQSSLLPCCRLSSVAVYQFPVRLGDISSTVVGALLICSGIALIVGLFSNRSHNCLAGIIRFPRCSRLLFIGYFFIRAPELGIFSIAGFIAGLFCVAGVIRR